MVALLDNCRQVRLDVMPFLRRNYSLIAVKRSPGRNQSTVSHYTRHAVKYTCSVHAWIETCTNVKRGGCVGHQSFSPVLGCGSDELDRDVVALPQQLRLGLMDVPRENRNDRGVAAHK